jgi:hypothetical protein
MSKQITAMSIWDDHLNADGSAFQQIETSGCRMRSDHGQGDNGDSKVNVAAVITMFDLDKKRHLDSAGDWQGFGTGKY